ncbi:xylose isomerase-like protein, partial [Baffinella frigidus]
VPSTGAAVVLVKDINRPNMGLTLDFGHCLAAGENPAQSAALAGSRGMLFGVQLNDGYQRLGAEDGLIFGSVHPHMALEFVRWLQKTNFAGHIYFDTFPRNEDPVREAEYNIRKFKTLWEKAKTLTEAGLDAITDKHDALAALELLD